MTQHRPKHPRVGVEKILEDAESWGWTIELLATGELLLECPCTDNLHWGVVVLKPTDPNYTSFVLDMVQQCSRSDSDES